MEFSFDTSPTYAGQFESILNSGDTAVFATFDADYGIVPEPRPAGELTATWDDGDLPAPITDAMHEGWIFRSPSRLEVNSLDGDERIEWADNFDRPVASTHHPSQMAGFRVPIDILKFHCYWTVHLPDGYSVLFTEPLGRPPALFTPFSGCVDYDRFPTVSHAPTLFEERTHTAFPVGTPLLQAIPFNRERMIRTAITREATPEECAALDDAEETPYERADRDPTTTSVEIDQTGE